MIVKVYNQKGEEIGEARLPKEIFEVKMNFDLVHQMVLSQEANRRQITAKTKDRSEKRGGGKKPWRQKGTGRARAGSNRSPIWKGGGVTFGPTTEKIFKKKIPKKMKRKALFMVLSAKAKENLFLVLDNLKNESCLSSDKKPKTRLMKKIADKLFFKKGSGLIVLPKIDKGIIKATKNIPKIATIQARDLNVLDLLSYKYVIMSKEAIKVIKDTFLK